MEKYKIGDQFIGIDGCLYTIIEIFPTIESFKYRRRDANGRIEVTETIHRIETLEYCIREGQMYPNTPIGKVLYGEV